MRQIAPLDVTYRFKRQNPETFGGYEVALSDDPCRRGAHQTNGDM